MADKQLFTASRARAYKKCPQLHHLKYVEGWRPTTVEEALAFGTLWHDALEAIFKTLQQVCGRVKCNYSRAWEAGMLHLKGVRDSTDTDPYLIAKAEVLVEAYVKRLKSIDFCKQFEIVAVEQEFRHPLINPDTEAASPMWDKAGKIDLIVRVKKDGRLRVIEHKTTSEDISPDSTYWSRLVLDGQIYGYVFALAHGSKSIDLMPDECGYNVVRKPLQRPAKATPIEKRKFKKRTKAQIEAGLAEDDPSLLYANQRLEDETVEEYASRLRGVVVGNEEDYVRWHVVPANEHRILEHLQASWDTAAQIRENMRVGRALKNEHACHQYGTCPFWPVCSGSESLTDNSRYERIKNKHPELEEVS